MLFRRFGHRYRLRGRNDFFEVPTVGSLAVAVVEFDFPNIGVSESDEGRYFERHPLQGSVAAESSGGRRIRSVERFEMFVSERVDCEGGHGVVGSFGIYLREGV